MLKEAEKIRQTTIDLVVRGEHPDGWSAIRKVSSQVLLNMTEAAHFPGCAEETFGIPSGTRWEPYWMRRERI